VIFSLTTYVHSALNGTTLDTSYKRDKETNKKKALTPHRLGYLSYKPVFPFQLPPHSRNWITKQTLTHQTKKIGQVLDPLSLPLPSASRLFRTVADRKKGKVPEKATERLRHQRLSSHPTKNRGSRCPRREPHFI